MVMSLKISLESGRVDVQNMPADSVSDEDKNAHTVELLESIAKELDELEVQIAESPREVLKQVWVLTTILDAHPHKWIKDYGKRRERNTVEKRLGDLRQRAANAMSEEEAEQVWDDLPYVRQALALLFAKLRTRGEVQRLILSPLGKLEYSEIRYQRDTVEDLARVCQEIQEQLRKTAALDDDVKKWGIQNRTALLAGDPPRQTPKGMVDNPLKGVVSLVVSLLLLGAGGAHAAGAIPAETVPVPAAAGLGAIAAGIIVGVLAVFWLSRYVGQLRKVPREFKELSARFRERLYLVCALRTLYQISSRFNVADGEFRKFMQDNGGQARWKRVKFEARDLTELFVNETWDPRGTVEHWLGEKVKTVYRLDSTHLAAPEDLDAESWDVILQAYLLESIDTEDGTLRDGQLLQQVSDLLFTKRGDDILAERQRIFSEVRDAIKEAERQIGRPV